LTAWQLIQADPELSSIATAIGARPELVLLLSGTEPLTLFMPTNTALLAMPTWPAISIDEVLFDDFLRGHVVAGALTSVDVLASFELTSIGDDTLVIDRLAGTINGATFVTIDAQATNGYLHTVNAPLITPAPTIETATTESTAPVTAAALLNG